MMRCAMNTNPLPVPDPVRRTAEVRDALLTLSLSLASLRRRLHASRSAEIEPVLARMDRQLSRIRMLDADALHGGA